MVTTRPVWTGWLAADLGVATLDVSLRLDIVTFWIGSRTLAVVDRDQLRAWVHDPVGRLRIDDLTFVLVDRQLCVEIDGGKAFPLSVAAVSQFVREL